MTAEEPSWPGCHGVRLAPAALAAGLGTSRGEPLLDAVLASGPVGEPGTRLLWRLTGEVELPDGPPVPVDQSLTEREDGSLHLFGPGGVHLAIDPGTRTITLEGKPVAPGDPALGPVAQQLVVTIGLPVLLHAAGVLVLHASAACRDGEAVLVSGRSGAGKSSLLVGLLDDGWQAVSEDLCAIDLRGDRPLVWPGPPWVRRAGAGPTGADVRFETPDKTAWDLAPWQVDEPVPLRAVTLLEPPGGTEVQRHPLTTPEALAAVARHAIWLGAPEDRAASVFGPCVRLVGAVPVTSMRVPFDPGWVASLREVL